MDSLEMYLAKRLEEHEREVEELERRLEEYRGLVSEKQIMIEESYLRLLKRLRLVAVERGPLGPRARRPFLRGYIEDWDFYNAYWRLDTGAYVSPPSSLRFTNANWALCKATGTINIVDGRIVTYLKCENTWGAGSVPTIVFRNDSAIGSVAFSNAYRVYIHVYYKRVYLQRFVNGSRTDVDINTVYSSIIATVDLRQWHQHRITWWTDPGGAGLFVRWEILIDDEWTKICDDLTDPSDYFSTPNTRRCGPGNNGAPDIWFDDTEIWSA